MTTKRKRDVEWWHDTVDWIKSKTGTIHDAIRWSEEQREMIMTDDVVKDTILMEIPKECIISLESTGIEKFRIDSGLYNEEQDVLIAVYLARQLEQGTGDFQNYLSTLPESASFDSLPRRWSEEDRDKLLGGSCILDRIKKSSDGAQTDFELVKDALGGQVPTFSNFDDMLAAVTSRAFAGFGATSQDSDIAMVPLLDLCNHRRGNVTKNISYKRTDKGVEVTSCVDIERGSVLAITYGAKGNAQLLFNYGFCIANNLEPDGSSNDIVELKLKDGKPPIEMRTGPKSFTFGPLCKAIELFHVHSEESGKESEDSENDLEEFLNDEEEDDMDDMLYGDVGEREEMQQDEMVKAELTAIDGLEAALVALLSSYNMTNDDISKYLAIEGVSMQSFAADMIRAEKRTIQFFQLVIGLLRDKLLKQVTPSFIWTIVLSNDDKNLLKKQAEELAAAFVRIRYSDFMEV